MRTHINQNRNRGRKLTIEWIVDHEIVFLHANELKLRGFDLRNFFTLRILWIETFYQSFISTKEFSVKELFSELNCPRPNIIVCSTFYPSKLNIFTCFHFHFTVIITIMVISLHLFGRVYNEDHCLIPQLAKFEQSLLLPLSVFLWGSLFTISAQSNFPVQCWTSEFRQEHLLLAKF